MRAPASTPPMREEAEGKVSGTISPAVPVEVRMLDAQDIACPYCGETISLLLDASAGSQRYIEDCHVCCRPITVVLDVDADGDAHVHVRSQDDA